MPEMGAMMMAPVTVNSAISAVSEAVVTIADMPVMKGRRGAEAADMSAMKATAAEAAAMEAADMSSAAMETASPETSAVKAMAAMSVANLRDEIVGCRLRRG